MTGTVLQGTIKVGDTIEIPSLGVTKKVKSIQMFRKGVDLVTHGDRAGVCVTQFDPSLLERGLICTPGSTPISSAVIIDLNGIPYFKGEVKSGAKFHISLGHETVMAKVTIFSKKSEGKFDFSEEHRFEEVFSKEDGSLSRFLLVEFERPVPVVPNSILIGSKLDSDINSNLCRLAFHGTVVWLATSKDYLKSELKNLKIYKEKSRNGIVERASNEYEVIVKDLVRKETNVELFTGLKVQLSSGETGTIEGTFGQSGKLKVRIMSGLNPETMTKIGGKKKKGEPVIASEPVILTLNFKRYIFDEKKRMIQF